MGVKRKSESTSMWIYVGFSSSWQWSTEVVVIQFGKYNYNRSARVDVAFLRGQANHI